MKNDVTASSAVTIDTLLQQVIDQIHSGTKPDIDQLCRDYPELAVELRETIPALLLIDSCRKPDTLQTGFSRQNAESGRQLGNYRLGREIGRGGMGVVYEAVQAPLGRRVAVKLLKERDPGEHSLKRFEREFQIVSNLHHTNIIPVFDAGLFEDQHYFAMQLVEGVNLDSWTQHSGKFPSVAAASTAKALLDPTGIDAEEEDHAPDREAGSASLDKTGDELQHSINDAVRIGMQVADALAYAHRNGVLHRDIKPGNILVDPSGQAWVSDFGLARPVESDTLTRSGDVVGTLRYLAPERLRGQCDARSDVYSLGLVLFELVTGRPAFDELDGPALLRQLHQSKRLRFGTNVRNLVPVDLRTVIEKSICPQPEARYQSAAEFADDLRRFSESRPVRARPVSLFRSVQLWTRRNPLAASLTLATGLSLVVGTIVAIVLASQWRSAAMLAEKHSNMTLAEAERSGLSLDLTRMALTELSSDVVEDFLTSKQTLSDNQRQYLKRVVDYHEQLAAIAGDDTESRFFAATSRRRVASISSMLGDDVMSRDALDESLVMLDSLVDEHPGEIRFVEELCASLIDRGRGHILEKEYRDARPLFEKAIACIEGLADGSSMSPRSQQLLATAIHNVGLIANLESDWESAAQLFSDALVLRTKTAEAFPDNVDFLNRLLGTLQQAGFVAMKRKRFDEALEYQSRVVDITRDLMDSSPGDRDRISAHASALDYQGMIFMESGREAEARECFMPALQYFSELAAGYPGVVRFAQQQGLVSMRLGRINELLEEFELADIHYRSSIDSQESLFERLPDSLDACCKLAIFRHALIEMIKSEKRAEAIELARQTVHDFRELIVRVPSNAQAKTELADYLDVLSGLIRESDPDEAELVQREVRAIRDSLKQDPN